MHESLDRTLGGSLFKFLYADMDLTTIRLKSNHSRLQRYLARKPRIWLRLAIESANICILCVQRCRLRVISQTWIIAVGQGR